MFDARDLLGRLMQAGMGETGKDRVGHAMGPEGLGRPGGSLSDLFTGVSAQAQSGLGDIATRAGSMFGTAKEAVKAGDPIAIGGLAALAGAVLGGGGRSVRGAVGAGLLAMLGSVAWEAVKKSRQASAADTASTPALPTALRKPESPAEEQAQQETAKLLVRAMISAAKADGAIDGAEIERIMGKLGEIGTGDAERTFVMDEMRRPLDLDGLVRDVKDPEVAAQVYTASLLAIKVDTPAEEEYLRKLAAGLGLDAATVAGVRDALGVESPA